MDTEPASSGSSTHFSVEYKNASRAEVLLGISALFIVLSTIFTGLRAWARRLHGGSWIWGDLLVPISLIFLIAMCAVTIATVKHGEFGRHADVVMLYAPDAMVLNLKIVNFVLPCLYCIAITLPKLAVLELYLGVFRERLAIWSCYAVAVITILTAIVNFFTTIFQCNPMDQMWNPVPDGGCMDVRALFRWGGFPNILTNVVMLLIPLSTVRHLQLDKKVKVGLIATFLTGLIGLAASITRFASLTHSTASDPLWHAVPAVIWTITEPAIYLIVACLVTFKPFLTRAKSRAQSPPPVPVEESTETTAPAWPPENSTSLAHSKSVRSVMSNVKSVKSNMSKKSFWSATSSDSRTVLTMENLGDRDAGDFGKSAWYASYA
ncbi:hypothetical protein EJ04DRAFT_499111 [Polyplosphaeria fusca]|uniref:Rhodopsin domain-containing protein n=1 Tax=Polyplosphaeria fusca TaxID=682080 RepID=A0A9P4QTC2_9PLEO|nr:hypothetical protein EJ04DRAFT_499111 [Polyplosphaeria fusca]